MAALTVALGQSTTAASFTAATGDTGNTVGAAADFCTAPGTNGVTTADKDAATNGTSGNRDSVYNGTTNAAGTSTGGDGYLYVRFNLPSAIPAGCDAATATLNLYAGTSQAARLQVYRVASTWSDTTLTWNNQPLLTGTPVQVDIPGGAGWQAFPVAAHVNAMLTGSNHGFVVRDILTNGGGTLTRYQIYNAFTNASNKPTLTITWG